jgi:hypothetical protein
MKVETATKLLANIPLPHTRDEFERAWKRTEDLRSLVDNSTDSQENKQRFDEAASRKQEEIENSWRSHEATRRD